MKLFNKIKNLVAELEADIAKFYEKNNQAAGTRARRSLQEIKTIAQELRMEIQKKKNDS